MESSRTGTVRTDQDTATRPAGDTDGGGGIGGLVSGIVEDLQGIVRGEVQLAKTELREDASAIGKGAGLLVGAALVGLVGFIFLMLTAVYVLDMWMRLWVAAAIVAGALLLLAAILGVVGKGRLSAANLKPEQAIESLKEDQQWASRQINSVRK